MHITVYVKYTNMCVHVHVLGHPPLVGPTPPAAPVSGLLFAKSPELSPLSTCVLPLCPDHALSSMPP